MQTEYEYVIVLENEDMQDMADLEFIEPKEVLPFMKKIINEKAKEGWEVVPPIGFPAIWFKRPLDV